MRHILYCQKCEKYTILETCDCGSKPISKKPPKYSPEDQYGKYRRMAKKEQLIKEGLL